VEGEGVLVWLGLAFILGGLAWSIGFIQLHRSAAAKAERAKSWPRVEGRIVESRIDVDETENSEGYTTQWFTPVVLYTYEVGGKTHEGKRIRFGATRTSDSKKAEAWAAAYPIGTVVEVLHDPLNPAEAVLETTKPASTYLVMSLVGIGFIGLGLFALA
jgi:hypothetical protein